MDEWRRGLSLPPPSRASPRRDASLQQQEAPALGTEQRITALRCADALAVAREHSKLIERASNLRESATQSGRDSVLTAVATLDLERQRAHCADRALHELGRARRTLVTAVVHVTLVVTR